MKEILEKILERAKRLEISVVILYKYDSNAKK